jgi:hypothetical protein
MGCFPRIEKSNMRVKNDKGYYFLYEFIKLHAREKKWHQQKHVACVPQQKHVEPLPCLLIEVSIHYAPAIAIKHHSFQAIFKKINTGEKEQIIDWFLTTQKKRSRKIANVNLAKLTVPLLVLYNPTIPDKLGTPRRPLGQVL